MISITVYTDNGETDEWQVENNENMDVLKVLLESKFQIPVAEQVLVFQGKELPKNATLDKLGVVDKSLILLQRRKELITPNMFQQFLQPILQQQNQQPQQRPVTDPEVVRQQILNDSNLLRQISLNDPVLYDAVMSTDKEKMRKIVIERENRKRQQELQQIQEINRLNSDPLNPDNQKLIEQQINMENINENREKAIEYIPESFASVVMLYVDCWVGDVLVKAFVDSGAQITIMSRACAERCGIMRLVDTRYIGVVQGVGKAKIIGRVHMAQIKLGKTFFPCSFTILDQDGLEFLFGLDMLKRYQCQIDLKDNVLKIGEEKVPFLAEKDLDQIHFPQTPPTEHIPHTPINNNNNNNQPSTGISNQPKPNPTTTTTTTTSNRPSFPEPVVQNLVSQGFSREAVIEALTLFNGNADAAASYLFGF